MTKKIFCAVLLGVLGSGLASCTVSMHTAPITLVELVIDGSPRLVPAGPEVHIGDRYLGQPVDGRFRILLPVGRHEMRLQGGADVYWQGVVDVVAIGEVQVVEIYYAAPVQGS